ncbi:DUF4382 domain-containing protein [Marinobacter sp. BGYM27]|uniref:DUF4382 domain-containing protein n=1 Tax=unclassified Marinobacter TaxID=83889 RepID=UPI0021A4CF76|nr:DUF4382 domain-containing protein [Marinobacter sp. BGYM27]MDG5499739.1 DUF4382 domain-containing protein [Marinobacter sp. BGYM27]
MKNTAKYMSIAALTAALAACGGGDSNDGSSAETGTLSMGLTDAPVDSVKEVNITITGIEAKPAGGDRIRFDFEKPISLNLLDLQNGAVAQLLADEEVPAGEYNWARLQLGDQSTFTVIADDGGTYTLRVPSGDQTGLKTSKFNVPAGGAAAFTIDFDVRKSLVKPNGGPTDYMLKPVLRLVENDNVGTIQGAVDSTVVASECSDATNYAGAVYIFEGAAAVPDDLGSANEPMMVAPVDTHTGNYDYTAAFVTAGEYTVSYTCDMDSVEDADENPVDEDLSFYGTQSATVEAGEITVSNFN